jgi:hypothetical protein
MRAQVKGCCQFLALIAVVFLAGMSNARAQVDCTQFMQYGIYDTNDVLRGDAQGQGLSLIGSLAVPIASLAISVVHTETSRSPQQASAPNYSPPERIEATRPVSNPFERSPVPMGRPITATGAQFAHFRGERLKPETRWRSGVDSNSRYRFLNWQDDSVQVTFAT